MSFSNHIISVTIISVSSIIGYQRFKIKLRRQAEKSAEQYRLWEQQWKDWMQEIGFEFPALYRENDMVPEAIGFEQLTQFIGDPDMIGYDDGGESTLIDINGKIVSLQFNESKREIYPVKIIDHKETPQELLAYLEPIIKNMLSVQQYEHVINMSSVPDIVTYLSTTLELE